MRIHASDEAFVRARRRDVHPYLADVGGYGAWWPGASSRPSSGGARLTLHPPGRLVRPQQLDIVITEERPDLGVAFRVGGDVVGDGEWYLLDELDGVRVNYLLRAESRVPGVRRRMGHHRSSVRAALHALKDVLESGRAVGEEPHPELLAAQQQAIAEFEAGVERHAKRAH